MCQENDGVENTLWFCFSFYQIDLFFDWKKLKRDKKQESHKCHTVFFIPHFDELTTLERKDQETQTKKF